jgi:alpha-tubulin suppressor-like RCC1 family protein
LDGASFEIDQDADGLTDSLETNTGTYVSVTNTGTNPLDDDSDNDGLKDGEEVFVHGTNPLLADTDGDGLNDNVETKTGTYVSGTDTGTDPLKADTDGDGLNDKMETKTGTFVSETDTGTDPSVADTDGDGVSDGVEIADGTNPNNVFNFKTTTNFVYTGSFQSFTVPEGVSQISFTLLGADGAAFSNGYSVLGGQGGTVTGTLNVIPGQTLKLGVGGAGNSNVGGWNGGGSDPFNRGGGGGGATDLFLSTTDWANLVAIAGGGSGGNAVGGFGGSGAGEGPNNGSFLNGSNGDGGGGGGYYGGLGGVTGGPGGRAGGGGSSWVDSSKVTTSSIAGGSDGTSNGSIQLRYVAEPIPRITAAPSPATGTVGGAASFPVTAETPGAGTAGLTYQWRKNGEEIPGATGSTFNLSILAVDNEGSYSVTVSNLYGSATSSEALLTVNKATPGIELPPLAGELTYGQTLSQAGLTGGTAKIGGLEVDGFFSFDSGDLKPAVGVAEQNITFTPLDSDNYNSVTLKVPVTVAKANLRAIAEDKSRSYRSGNPAFTVRYIGLVAGDTALEVVPVMTTTATPASVPGTYPITISAGVLSSNYTVEFVGGTLTVLDGDFDQDGASDSSELAAGTDPANPADRPMLLSAGWNHTLYVPQAGGYALAWGLNTDGRCGVGHTNSPLTTGVRTVGADGKELSGIIQAAAGGGHSLLLQNLGGQITLLAAGANANGQLGITNAFSDRFLPVASGLPTNLLAIAAGARHSLALDTDGKVYAWGDNLQGQVGVNTNRSVIRTPTRVTNALAALRIKAVAAGAEHSLVLAEDGKVYSWGRGNGGALGYTALGAVRAPRQITNLSSIRQIAAGDKHSLFLNAGKVYACGDNSLGQLGLPSSVLFTNTPVEIPFPGGVTIRKLVAGLDRCLAIAEDGRVFGWGYNRYGELGLGFASTNAPFAVFQPQEVKALYGATEIAGGGFQTFALGSSGTLLASGLNEGGQLGVGGTNNVSSAPAPTKEAGKRDQILTFELPGPLPVGTPVVLAGFSTPVIPLAGDLGAGPVPVLGVSYVSSDVSVASVLDGVLTLHRPGTVTITATQSGNDLYNAAAPVSRTITVVKGTADILIGGLRQSFDGTPKPVQVTTVPPGLAVNITYNGGAGAPQAIGVYEVAVTVVDDNYQRIVQQNLEIRPYLTLEMATAEATYDLGSGPQILDTTVRAEGAPATLSAASVRIEEGLVAGDVLALTNPPAGITASWSAARGLLRLSGAASVADYQTALRRVTFATTSTNTNNRVINMTLGSAVGHAGHAYEYVSQNLTWPDARTAAKGRSLFLENGYLANVTSAGENQAVLGLLQEAGKDAWLGGADTTDGNFRWMDGPNSEAGSKFWNGNSGGSGVGGQFANWGAGQPDNKSWVVGREIDYILFVPIYKNIYDYESFLMMSHSTSLALGGNSYPSSPGKWNDAPLKTSANSFYRLGSVVEYGGSQPVFFTDQRTLQVRPNPFANNVNFTSTASEISVPMPTAAMGGMTLEFWMKPASGLGSGTYSVVRKNSPLGSSELSVSLNYSSSTIASLSATVTPAAGSPATASANLIDPLAWNHVALVVSGSSVQFFINGTAGSSAMLMGALALSNQPLVFGSSFRGQIDDIRIYSGVRSGSQISADKTGPALAPYDSSLVAYYKLDEGSGTALADATGVNGAATGGNIGWGPGRSPGVWDITSGDYRLQDDGSSLLLELGGLEGTTLYDQIFVWNGAATLDGIINLMFIGAYTGPVSGSWHTFDLIWAKNGIVFGDNYQLSFNQPGLTVETNVVEKDGGQLWQATIREAVSQADLEQAAALAQPALGISRSPGPAGTVEMMYTYTRPAGGSYVGGQYAANGVRYEVQVSGDLKTWVPAALEEVGAVPAGAGYENVTMKIVSGSPKAFLKLKISN